ncbi:MAG TPA: hypothetical protein VFE59_05285, partial [Trebonia sp.]|nr:hypothetical protein [Trebonia sp.]
DDGKYPKKVKVSGQRMKYLEERVIARHGFHGEWNYTIRPAPAEPEPGPPAAEEAPAPGADPAFLASLAAAAGIADLPALLAAVAVPFAAAREQRLHLARGRGRRKASGGGPKRLPFEAIVTAAACHLRLRMPCRLLGELLGAHETTISLAARRIIPLLAEHGITPQDGGMRIPTLDELRKQAARQQESPHHRHTMTDGINPRKTPQPSNATRPKLKTDAYLA